MKKLIHILIVSVFPFANTFCQEPIPAEKSDVKKVESKIIDLNKKFEEATNKNIQFGISLGYRFLTEDSRNEYQSASISPIDSSLVLNRIEDGSFLLSTSVIFNPKFPTEKISKNLRNQILIHLIGDENKTERNLSLDEKILLNALFPNSVGLFNQVGDIIDYLNKERLAGDTFESSEITPALVYGFTSRLDEEIEAKSKTVDRSEIKRLEKLKKRVKWLVFKQFFIEYIIDRISINANLNLLEFSTAQEELSFNQSIDGGLGISYMLNPNLYIGVNWENFTVRQLQGYIKEMEGKQIEINGKTAASINDLDQTNNNLYTNRSFSGISFKLITSF